MSSQNHVKNIAIVGAGGTIGSEITKSLLQCGTFNVTAISRPESSAMFMPGITVKKGDYSSSEFLESTLQGQDVLIITLAVTASLDVQTNFIKAAAKVGVPWILPNEYGSDGANPELCKAVPVHGVKEKFRSQIEELGVSSWIGLVCNQWFDFSLKGGSFGINIRSRKATILDDGTNAVNTTTLPQCGCAIAQLLSLPVQQSSSSPSLSDYKNKFIYIKSFSVSQNDMLAAVQRATHTKSSDWSVTHTPVDEYIKEGREKFGKGDRWGMVQVLYGALFKKGLGDKYYGKDVANEILGLKEENLDEATERVVQQVEAQ